MPVKNKKTCVCHFLIVQVSNDSKEYSSSVFSAKTILITAFYFLMIQKKKKNLMLTPQVNWKYPFDSYQLCKKSNHKNKFWLWMCFNRSELTCKCRSFSYYSCAEPSTLRYLFRHISIFLGQS